MVRSGFGSKAVLRLTGVTYRQLVHWDKTGLVGSSVRAAAGRGSRRVYSFEDLVALRVVARLREADISLQTVRRAVQYLKRHTDRPLSRFALIPSGKKVLVPTEDPAKMVEASQHGQVTIEIPVKPIVERLELDVTELGAPREVDVRVGGRAYRAVLTPDLEVGGFTVEVPELPGCLTEGDTLAEAKRMAKDAIELWLSVAEPREAKSASRSR
jgi:predicted RNase H-like HicB family nuclease/DNA-binding transcriptional MerR regulator